MHKSLEMCAFLQINNDIKQDVTFHEYIVSI